MKLTLSPTIEAALGKKVAQVGVSPQEWVRMLIVSNLGLARLSGGDPEVTLKGPQSNPEVTLDTQSSSSLIPSEDQEKKDGDGDPEVTLNGPSAEEREMGAWKPSAGQSTMPYENFKSAVKTLFFDNELVAPPVKQINAWAKMLSHRDAARGRWLLVRLLTDVGNRGDLAKGKNYLYGCVRREASDMASSDREVLRELQANTELTVQ